MALVTQLVKWWASVSVNAKDRMTVSCVDQPQGQLMGKCIGDFQRPDGATVALINSRDQNGP